MLYASSVINIHYLLGTSHLSRKGGTVVAQAAPQQRYSPGMQVGGGGDGAERSGAVQEIEKASKRVWLRVERARGGIKGKSGGIGMVRRTEMC